MRPMNEVTAKPIGMVRSWDHRASRGFWAKRLKSGSLTIKVAKLDMDAMMPAIHPQASLEPEASAGCRTMGPSPLARTMAQMKKAIPAAGTKYALTVNKWRILWTGGHRKGSEPSQKMKKPTKSRVEVPEFGMPLWMSLNDGHYQREDVRHCILHRHIGMGRRLTIDLIIKVTH